MVRLVCSSVTVMQVHPDETGSTSSYLSKREVQPFGQILRPSSYISVVRFILELLAGYRSIIVEYGSQQVRISRDHDQLNCQDKEHCICDEVWACPLDRPEEERYQGIA